MDISILMPVYNEEKNVSSAYEEVSQVLLNIGKSYEIIFINDGSTDCTLDSLKKIQLSHSDVKIVDLTRNFGQTAAIAAGFHISNGSIVITMDGDLQNDPTDIPRFLEEIEKGFDVVSGWRRKRMDPFARRILSKLANCLISMVLGVKLHDYGCAIKAFRKGVVKNLNLYGEMHRFIPAVAGWTGARIREIEVNHRKRAHGTSKYGYRRVVRVFLDLLVMLFLSEYRTKPIRFFGGLAIANFLLGTTSLAILVYMKIFMATDMTGNPFLILAVLFFLVSIQLISIGFISEINIRTYYESQHKTIYNIKEVIG
ncbi:MAG: glycosyltransferase family 2 protein [Candidatus Omnitrophota bacterium]